MVEGYFVSLDRQAEIARMASFRLYQCWVGDKSMSIRSFWPLGIDGAVGANDTVKVMDKEQWDSIMKLHNIKQ